ncbi:MAG: copper amine oxidase N-terminal domain-containing protein [Syntrophomonas sp.]
MGNKSRAWYLCIVLILLLGIGLGNQAWAAGNATFTVGSTSYYMDGVAQNMEVAPYINNGRTYVPILYLAQALGVQTNDVVWDAGNATITLSKGDQAIQMQVGSKTLLVNGAPRQMDAAPEITSGRTFLPAGFVAQGLGYSVDWDAASQTIKLNQGSSPDPSVNNTNTQAQTEPKTWEDWPAASTDDPNHTWTIVFKQAMDTSTLNSINIYVSPDVDGSRRIEGVGITSSDSTHALVSPPTGGWKAETKYYLIITKKALTREGEPLKDFVRMPFSLTDDNSTDSEEVLTPDYWIPDINKKYIYRRSSSVNNPVSDVQAEWISQNDRYIEKKTMDVEYADLYTTWVQQISETKIYTINSNSVMLVEHGEDTGQVETKHVISGNSAVVSPVNPNQYWNINYSSLMNLSDRLEKFTGQATFVGFDNINIMGTKEKAAHIHIEKQAESSDEYSHSINKYFEDYWLVKGLGVVKMQSKIEYSYTTASGEKSNHIQELQEELVSVS